MLFRLCILLIAFSSVVHGANHIILAGGPALRAWENLRVEEDRHDRWWANFIRASTLRMDMLRQAHGPEASFTWIVYKPSYVQRAREDGKPYPTWIQEQATKRGARLVWVSNGDQAIRAINRHPPRSVITFDYFGHSNRQCFMLDYGSDVMAVSQAWIHERDLGKIKGRVFAKNAQLQSFGCHTGESMSQVWRRKVGNTLVGAKGKTDYVWLNKGILPRVNGRWIR